MSCHRLNKDTIICTANIYEFPYMGRVWVFERHPYCGPVWLRKDSREPCRANPPDSFYAAYNAWFNLPANEREIYRWGE